jgi:hypothetical protein
MKRALATVIYYSGIAIISLAIALAAFAVGFQIYKEPLTILGIVVLFIALIIPLALWEWAKIILRK